MSTKKVLKLFSGLAIFLAGIHIFWPALGIDIITVTLLVIASLPWLIPYLRSIELPGGVKIELQDVINATESIPDSKASHAIPEQDTKLISDLSRIADQDSNLALVGFRIELEKKLRHAAELNSITVQSKSLQALVEELKSSRILPEYLARDLREIIDLGNKAVHGVPVTKDAAVYMINKGPSILSAIDAYYSFESNNA